MIKNIGKSIRTRLLNLAKEEKQEYMKVLVRYVGTFKNRNTPYRENLALFTDKFATDATRNIWWKAFLKKIRWKEQIDFSVVMKCIKENLQAYWNKETLG